MKIKITDPIEIDSFYKEFREPELSDDYEKEPIPCCMYDCDNLADKEVIFKSHIEYICKDCFNQKDYQELLKSYRVTIKNL